MSDQQNKMQFTPWVHRSAFPFVMGAFYLAQLAMGYSIYKGWVWLSIPLVILLSHLLHGVLIGYHEAAHGRLRKSHFLNELDGYLVGTLSLTSFTLYRVLHQSHHVHFASKKDVELWPFVDPKSSLWGRRIAAFLELNFGFFYTPCLFWRAFFVRNSEIKNPGIRKKIWIELVIALVFWVAVLGTVIHFQLWPWFLWSYFIPSFIAANLQSWRKYIEHVGMSGNTARSGTRTIVADTWAGQFVSLTLLHEPLHGIHHIKSKIPHSELPEHTELLEAQEDGDTEPFPNYRAAFLDLMKRLPDPKVGGQWNTELVPKN